MPNTWFQFKQFIVHQEQAGMKVTTDACLFGAWTANEISHGTKIPLQVLDIGTGTGLLALMLAQKINGKFEAIEIEPGAAEEAQSNFKLSSWADKIQLIHTDLRQFAPAKKYDVIISNPPFYENELTSPDQKKNMAHHSSVISLEELVTAIKILLQPNGSFFMMMPYKRFEETNRLLNLAGIKINKVAFVRQSVNHSYFRFFICGSISDTGQVDTRQEIISITDAQKNYTHSFTELLKDYYLHL